MSVRVESAALVGLLADLIPLAASPDDGGPLAAVLLHGTRADRAGEPGRQDLLVGTSMDRFVAGHTWAPAEGVSRPMLWPVDDASTVLGALKIKIRGEKKDGGPRHRVCLRVVGDRVEIAEDAAQKSMFGEDDPWAFAFQLASLDEYPRGVWDLLATGDRAVPLPVRSEAGDPVEPLPRTDIGADQLRPFVAIAKRRGWALQTYRTHHRLPVHIQIGWGFRGLIIPKGFNEEHEDGFCPDVPVHNPDLPPPPPPKLKPSDPHPVDLDRDDQDGES